VNPEVPEISGEVKFLPPTWEAHAASEVVFIFGHGISTQLSG